MKVADISYQGLTLDETKVLYPHVILIPVMSWTEFELRVDSAAVWLNDQGLIHEQDFFTDVTSVLRTFIGEEYNMVEIWAFKDPKVAMLFKLMFS